MKVLLLHLKQFAYPTAKRNVWGVHWCKEIKNKLSHMLKCMYSQNSWLDHPTPFSSTVICDLLFCNKLPHHIILTGIPNQACKKLHNYSPLLSKKPSSIPIELFIHNAPSVFYYNLLAWNSGLLLWVSIKLLLNDFVYFHNCIFMYYGQL